MNSFYSTGDMVTAESQLSCTLHYNANHEIFSGHFPGNPVVPGVCTMAMVKELLSGAVGQKLTLTESKAVKFLGLINPSMSPRLSVSWKEEGTQIVATVSLQDGTSPLFKMIAHYLPATL